MSDWQRRISWAAGIVVTTLLSYALAYQWGMWAYEDQSVIFVQALQVVIESITTAGFGGHAPWSSPQMNAMVLLMNLTGVLFVFLAVPLFVVPVLREAFEQRPPKTFAGEGHVVLTPHTSRIEVLVEELEARDRSYVILEPSRERARTLHLAGSPAIHGDPESVDALERVSLPAAAALVVDGQDAVDTSVILAARELSGTIQTVSVIDDETLEPYHWMAGADHVLSPRQLLGKGLAREIPFLMPTIDDPAIEIGEHLEVAEVDVEEESALCNQTIGQLRLRERFGVNVLGVWVDGTFESPVGPETLVDDNTRLLVSGTPDVVRTLRRDEIATFRPPAQQRVVVIGYGRSGQAAVEVLATTKARLTIIDSREHLDVDLVGDARDPRVYEDADVGTADAILIDIDDDTTALFATLIARNANPDAHIVARANERENERKIYRAGADYVQSLATVSGRMMAETILGDEDVLSFRMKIDVVRLGVGRLADQTLAGADVRSNTGCTVVAAVRGDEVITSLDPDEFVFREDDQVVVVGTDEGVRRFEERFLR